MRRPIAHPGFLASVALMIVSTGQAADTAPRPRPLAAHVALFADGFDAPLATFLESVVWANECKRRFQDACGGVGMDPALVDFGSLAAKAHAHVSPPGFATATDAKSRLKELSGRLAAQMREFDLELYARIAAVISACASRKEDRLDVLASIYRADVLRFQQRPPADLPPGVERLEQQRAARAELIKQRWSASSCQKAAALAHRLEASLYRKVRSVYDEDSMPLSSRDANGLLFGHVYQVALELAKDHEPDVAARIEAHASASPSD